MSDKLVKIFTCDVCGKEHNAQFKDELNAAVYPQTWAHIEASFWTRRCTRGAKLDICPECSKKMLFIIEPENFNSGDPLYELFQIKKDKEPS